MSKNSSKEKKDLLVNHISDKWLLSKIYMELIQQQKKKKTNNPLKNEQKT